MKTFKVYYTETDSFGRITKNTYEVVKANTDKEAQSKFEELCKGCKVKVTAVRPK